MYVVLSALTRLIAPVWRRLRREDGLEAIEYALIAALLGVVIVGAVSILSPALENAYQNIANVLQNPEGSVDPPAPGDGDGNGDGDGDGDGG